MILDNHCLENTIIDALIHRPKPANKLSWAELRICKAQTQYIYKTLSSSWAQQAL